MRENITKHQRKFSLSLSVNNLYLDLYYVLMEVTVTPFAEVLSHRNRPTSWKAQQLNLITLMELGNFPFGVGFLTRQIRAILPQVFCEKKPYSRPRHLFFLNLGKILISPIQGIWCIVTYRCRTGSRSMSNLSIGSRFVHFTMKSCARSLHPCSCIGITTSQNIVMRRKCSSCSVSEDPSSVESSKGDLHTRQISFEIYTLNCKLSRCLCSED